MKAIFCCCPQIFTYFAHLRWILQFLPWLLRCLGLTRCPGIMDVQGIHRFDNHCEELCCVWWLTHKLGWFQCGIPGWRCGASLWWSLYWSRFWSRLWIFVGVVVGVFIGCVPLSSSPTTITLTVPIFGPTSTFIPPYPFFEFLVKFSLHSLINFFHVSFFCFLCSDNVPFVQVHHPFLFLVLPLNFNIGLAVRFHFFCGMTVYFFLSDSDFKITT